MNVASVYFERKASFSSGKPLKRTGSKPPLPPRFFWMKWLTGHVRWQLTGRKPTLNERAEASGVRNRSRVSQACRSETDAIQTRLLHDTAFFSEIAPFSSLAIISYYDIIFKSVATKDSRWVEPDYQNLAWFRHLIRRFLAFSEAEARGAGLKPQQHQLLLAVKGLPPNALPTIGALAWQLQLKHHTVVGLVDRLSALGLVRRNRNALDHREVLIDITPKGEALLGKLSVAHRAELQRVVPLLLPALASLFDSPKAPARKARR